MKIIDAITMPTGEMVAVDLLGYLVPREIVAYFLIRDETPLNKHGLNWSVELRIRIGDKGTPFVQSLTHRGLTNQREIYLNSVGDYITKSDHAGVTRKQINIIENELGTLIDNSLSLMLQSHTPIKGGFTVLAKNRKISEKDLRSFRNEMKNRSAKTKLTPEFLTLISEIYLNEVTRSKKAGDRTRTTEAIWEATGFTKDKKTVEAWVAKARELGFLPESSKKKVSAAKAKSNVNPKARKVKNGKK